MRNPNISIKLTDTLLDVNITNRNKLYDKIIGNPPYGARNDSQKKNALNTIYKGLYTKESYTLFLYACIQCLKEGGELSFIIPDTFLSLHRHLSIRRFLLTNTRIKELALFPSSFFPGVNFGYANLCIITLVKSSDIQKNLDNTFILKSGFKNVDELDVSNKWCYNKKVSQLSVYKNISSAFMFNSTEELTRIINNDSIQTIGDIATCVTGFYSGDDKSYLHPIDNSVKNSKKYTVMPMENLRITPLSEDEKRFGIDNHKCFVPIVKGGNIAYIKPNQWFMDWSTQAIKEYRNSKKCRFQNSNFYFRNGIGIPMIRSTKLTGALIDGRLFDQSIVGVFPHDDSLTNYLLGFFNSSICTRLIQTINPSTNNSANYIKKIPFVEPGTSIKTEVDNIVCEIISSIRKGNTEHDIFEKKLDMIFDSLYLDC